MSAAVPQPVARLLDAANATDLDAYLAALVDGDVVDDRGRRFVGAVIRSWSIVNSSAGGVNLEVGGVGTWVVTAEVGGGGANGLSHFSFALDGDRVAPI